MSRILAFGTFPGRIGGGRMSRVHFVVFLLGAASSTPALHATSRRLSSQYQTDKLTLSDAEVGDECGWSVATDGDLIVVGSIFSDNDAGNRSGGAYIFQSLDDGGWTEMQKLTASDGADDDRFGAAVAIAGNLIVVGAHRDINETDRNGSAYVFRRLDDDDGQNWTHVQTLTGDAANDRFGRSIAIAGNLIVVSAHLDADIEQGAGAVYVFKSFDDENNFTKVAKFSASDAAQSDRFGYSVALVGNVIIAGAYRDDDAGSNSGSAYVFQSLDNGTTWSEVQKLTASDSAAGDNFGISIAMTRNILVVGARAVDDESRSFNNSGAAYVFLSLDDGESWDQVQKLTASDAKSNNAFGHFRLHRRQSHRRWCL